jgi:phosphate starvation-inducible membrane PsiE
MAEQNIKLPDLDNTLGSSTKSETSKDMQSIPVDNTTSGKEIVIAFGAVLIAAIIFFIVKNYVSKMLVANQRKSPRSADMAGWSLFSFLLFAAITAVLAILNSTKFLSLPYLIPLGLAMIVSLIIFFVALLSKR